MVVLVYTWLLADMGESPQGPPNHLRDALTYTLMIMIILITPSIVGALAYAPFLHERAGEASRGKALLLSPIAFTGVWLLAAFGNQSAPAIMLTFIATVLFGALVPLPRSYAP